MKKQKLLCNIRKEDRSNGGATPNYLHLHVTKKQATVEDRMINSNNNILYPKSYLNICIKHKCVFMNFKSVP